MKKIIVLTILLFSNCYAAEVYDNPIRILVYKGTIKSTSFFDVNDTSRLVSQCIKGYWVIKFVCDGPSSGYILDANAIIFQTKPEKFYKVIPDEITIDPYDPGGVVMIHFNASDADGNMVFYATGKFKPVKYCNEPGIDKDLLPVCLTGTGNLDNFDLFDPAFTYSGPYCVKLVLDSRLTRQANTEIECSAGEILDELVEELDEKGFIGWPYYPRIEEPADI